MARQLSAQDIGSTCVCLGIRKIARQVARRYDEAFRPLGITSGQFSILAALLRDEPVPLGALADTLGMDRTTLNRNLKPLEHSRLVGTATDRKDRRIRGVALTDAGRALLHRAIPAWRLAQADSARRLQPAAWPALQSKLNALS